MRIACVPLDSRPVNWQFPQRLAGIAGVDLLLPPRSMLGTLTVGAEQRELVRWLRQQAREADAVVFSWDALIYGGLVQSRDPALSVVDPAEIYENLASVDWRRTAGYAYATLPRLGITTASSGALHRHEAVRELFIAAGDEEHPVDERKAGELVDLLGLEFVERLFAWRRRNLAHLLAAAELSCRLGLRRLHVPVEDNAPRGPHLDELKELRRKRLELLHEGNTTKVTTFDGADEAGCLLLARAVLDHREATVLPVQLTVHPVTPGPQNYRGLFETHSLQDGLDFLARFLGFRYTDGPAGVQWLVAHGIQPQPDAFTGDPERIYASPYLLPREVAGRGGLFVSDLAVCNSANPQLAYKLAEIARGSLSCIVGFNTNFNSLGLSAALISLAHLTPGSRSVKRFCLERLADDLVYQAISRRQVAQQLASKGLDPLNFGGASSARIDECLRIVRQTWLDWIDGGGRQVLAAMGLASDRASNMEFEFPWSRTFEIEASLPPEPDAGNDSA